MCGICGFCNLEDGEPPAEELLRRMVGVLGHRGPDGNGGFIDDHAALGQTRLSIIDLAGGAQPMQNEDGQLWVVFNGEIYNYVELGEELRGLGHRFRTRSDTEVILHAYEQWGLDCPSRFNGQFAFALWDRRQRCLVLCRDRVGIRPLYYAVSPTGDRLMFASEIKAIFQDKTVSREFDLEGLAQVFTLWTTLAPRTAFRGIRQLRPGTLLVVRDGRFEEKTYWQPRFLDAERPAGYLGERQLEDLGQELLARLEAATRLRMLRADVPVGVYVSGGLDSSVIGALVRRFHSGPLRTFSLRFREAEFDEGRFQDAVVSRLGTEHASVEVGPEDIARVFPEVVRFTETPILRTAPAPLFMLSGLVRAAGYKVVLTGEGADEFLAGYDLFREDKVRRFWARRPGSVLRPRLLSRLYPWMGRSPAQAQALQRSFFGRGLERSGEVQFSHLPRWQTTSALLRLLSREASARLAGFDAEADLVESLPAEVRGWEPLGRAQYLEIVTLLQGYLLSSQGDRMLMGHSVEGRFPFLDHEVMEFCCALPPEAKLRVLDEKHLLKRAARDLVPEEVRRRPKQPYRAPDAQSFTQGQPPEYLHEVLSSDAVTEAGIFEPRAAALLWQKCLKLGDRAPSNTDNMAAIGLISTQLLHRLFIAGNGPSGHVPERLEVWQDLRGRR